MDMSNARAQLFGGQQHPEPVFITLRHEPAVKAPKNGKPVFKLLPNQFNHEKKQLFLAPNGEKCTLDAQLKPVFIRKEARRQYEFEQREARRQKEREQRKAEEQAKKNEAKRVRECEAYVSWLGDGLAKSFDDAMNQKPSTLDRKTAKVLIETHTPYRAQVVPPVAKRHASVNRTNVGNPGFKATGKKKGNPKGKHH